MGAIAAVAIVAAAAAAGSAYMKSDAARKGANAMKDAIGNVERINVAKESSLARQYDEEKFKGQLELQKKLDPTLAALREKSASSLLANVSNENDSKAQALLGKLADENMQEEPGIAAIKKKLLDDAVADLERGAELPPDFQNELVRTGLESGARSGFAAAAGTGGAQLSRKLLGQAGIALQNQRREFATNAATTASNLEAARTNIITNTAAAISNLNNSQSSRAAAGFALANAAAPGFGLSGADAVNLDLARINQQQQLTLGAGQVEMQKRIAQGEANAAYVSAAGQALGGMAGGGLFGSAIQNAYGSYAGSNITGFGTQSGKTGTGTSSGGITISLGGGK